MISIDIDVSEDLRTIEALKQSIASGEHFAQIYGPIMERALGFARQISPVQTGSYKDAHIIVFERNSAALFIDPHARNQAVPVSRYAEAVEDRYHVYEQTDRFIGSMV